MGVRGWRWILGAVAVVAAVFGVAVRRHRVDVDLATQVDLHGVAYVGAAACRDCHLDHFASWKRTFHRTMTAEATPAFVKGDFGGATMTAAGVTARMDHAGDRFRVTFSRTGEPVRVASVDRTVGSRRYQQYLTKVGDTYWRLPVAWNVEDRRWFPMTSAFLFRDPDPAHPTDPADARPVFGGGDFDRHVTRWNDNCVFCHNVAPNPARDPNTGRFATTVAELGIACEACHGPGAEHVRRNADPLRRARLEDTGVADPTIVNPSRLSPGRAADLCGRCHGQRLADDVAPFLAHGDPFVPGDDLAVESAPLWRDTPLRGDRTAFAARFWTDGTPRLTAYEYQGLLQSPCAMRGPLTCTSCHGMHEGDPRGQLRARFADTNAMCTGCHATLAVAPALRAHAHHDPAGAGARCVSCHMPRIVYGVLDVHPSHRIEVPDPARNAVAGRPDSCTGCHVDRTAGWAQAAARGWWPGGRYPADAAVPAGTAPVEAIQMGEAVARAVAADAIARAPAIADPPTRIRRLALLLAAMSNDTYPAVREIAWRGLRRMTLADPSTAEVLRRIGYDPAAAPIQRIHYVKALRQTLGVPAELAGAAAPPGGGEPDLEIGE